MAKILYVGTHGSDNTSLASLPFVGANGAKDAGHEPLVALLADATYLLKKEVAEAIQGVGLPPLKDLLATTVKNKTPIYV